MLSAEDIEERFQHFKKAIQAAGVKLTPQRLEIFWVMASSPEHPDAERVYQLVKSRLETVSRDTVYRTSWKLYDLGLITTLGNRGENIRFDPNLRKHHHFICLRCGRAHDFENATFNKLKIPEQVQSLGEVTFAQVELKGVCHDCSKKEAANKRAQGRSTHLSKRGKK